MIRQHMAYAGACRDVFTDGAVDDVYRFSSGAARLINKLCPHSICREGQSPPRGRFSINWITQNY